MSNWEKTMKEWDDSIPDGIKYLSAENRVLTRKVRELESENDALQSRIAELEKFIGKLIEAGESEDSPMPAVWLELVNDWKEREG